MKFKTFKPYQHQLIGLQLHRDKGNVALLWEMGAGKTFGMITILREIFTKEQRLMRTLVISPTVTLNNWKKEFDMHSYIPQSQVHVASGSTLSKVKVVKKKGFDADMLPQGQIIITNYESMIAKGFVDVINAWQPEVIVLDESHYIKNHKAKRTKAIIDLGKKAKHKFIMTGTLILNDVRDIFSQYLFLDDGETFGRNYYVFQARYMEDANSGWSSKPNHFSKWVTRMETYEEVSEKIYERGHRVRTVDVVDLPPRVRIPREVAMTPEQAKHYKEMERDFITFVETKTAEGMPEASVATVAVVKALRLMQICSGFMSLESGETVELKKTHKQELVKELLEEIVVANKHSCILWCSFRYDYQTLFKICKELNIPHGFITGEQSLEEKTIDMDKFNAGEYPVIIANRRAGGIGINLVKASYSITYSRNFSLGEELQSAARNYRGGSQMHDKIIAIDLYTTGTIEELVAEALANKQEVSNKIIDLVKGVKK